MAKEEPQGNLKIKGQSPRILQLNNTYTREQQKIQEELPKRRYLGLIFVTVIIVLTIPAYGLISSYQNLQKSIKDNVTTTSESKELAYQATSQSKMIDNMQNTFYIEKFARSEYFYTKDGEKVFTTPNQDTATSSSQ